MDKDPRWGQEESVVAQGQEVWPECWEKRSEREEKGSQGLVGTEPYGQSLNFIQGCWETSGWLKQEDAIT